MIYFLLVDTTFFCQATTTVKQDSLPLGQRTYSNRIDQIDTSYPITPNFEEWQFPHCNLPLNWQLPQSVSPIHPHKTRSDASLAVAIRDEDQCRVTGRREQCVVAHIIPVEEDDWFHANDMSRYVFDPMRQSRSAITDINNLMLLRMDLHRSFDVERKFVFCPKKPEPHLSNMVIHLTSPSEEYGWLYHNAASYSLDCIPREYLFARFAWAIFPKVEAFLLRNVERSLITVAKGQHLAGPDDCKGFTVSRSKRSGTGSPKKRQRPTHPSESQNEEVDQDTGCDQDSACSKRAKMLPTQPVLQDIKSIGIPPSVSSSSTKFYDPSAPSNLLPEWKHFFNLRERALEKERQRSDRDGYWLEERRWAMGYVGEGCVDKGCVVG